MPSLLAFAAGGLLEGTGKGLVLDGKQKYEALLKKLDREHDLARDTQRQGAAQGLLGQRITADDARQTRGDASAVERLNLQLENQRTIAETRESNLTQRAGQGASEASTRADAQNKARIAAAKLVAEDRLKAAELVAAAKEKKGENQADIDRITERHLKTDELGQLTDEIDYEAAAKDQEANGNPIAAASLRRKAKGVDKLDLDKRANEYAAARVNEQSSMFGLDSAEFRQDGGSRVNFHARMVREFKAAEKGGTPLAAPPPTQPAAASGGGGRGGGRSAATQPYVGETAPPHEPKARRAPDGFWYLAPLPPSTKHRRVLKP